MHKLVFGYCVRHSIVSAKLDGYIFGCYLVLITVVQKCHGNFNLLTAISTCSREFQFVHGNFNLLTAISTCSRQFQFFHSNAHGIFRFAHHQSTSASDSGHQKSKRKIESRYLKSIFKVKSENQKLKVHSRTLMPVDSE